MSDFEKNPASIGNSEEKIVDMAAFRRKKFVENDLARGRKPLFVSHLDSKVTGSPHFNNPTGESDDLGDRIQRIRTSLQKINRLMAELKRMSAVEDTAKA